MAFGDLLRQARTAAGLSLVKLSEALEGVGTPLDPSYISRIETGKRSASEDQVRAFCAVLDITDMDLSRHEPGGAAEGSAGQRLRQVRRAKGVSLVELSERMRELGEPVGFATLSKYETGAKPPSVPKLRAAAAALGVQLAELVGEPAPAPEGLTEVERELIRAWRTDGGVGVMLWCANWMREQEPDP